VHTASSTAGPAGDPDGRDPADVPDYVDLAWHGDDNRRPGPPRSLQMRAIAAAGVELADEGGLSRVSMRTVGARLGMTGMGLYRYVRAKDELLALMIDEAIGPPDFPAYGQASWRDRLTAWAYAARSRFEAHPWVLGVSLPDPPALPHQTQWTERGLEALQPTPLAETEKLSALLLVNVYVRGQTQLATGLGRRVQPGDNPGQRYARMLLRLADPERFPRLVAAMTQHAAAPPADFTADEFRFGLSTVLDGIASRMTPGVLLGVPDEARGSGSGGGGAGRGLAAGAALRLTSWSYRPRRYCAQ
jgi:AcrR family transcriptional regulator